MNFRQFVSMILLVCFSILNASAQNESGGLAPIFELNEGQYSIRVSGIEAKIDSRIGGRITELNIAGVNFFTDSSVNNFNWGTSFWFSPQSDWNWPPSATIDNKPYHHKAEGNRIILQSEPDPNTGLVVTKVIYGDLRDSSISIVYRIFNSSEEVQKVAPWEVSRVHINGLSFFPNGGEDSLRGGLAHLVKITKGIQWFQYEKDKLPTHGDRQLYTDGAEGWFAQVNKRVLFVKKFPDIQPADAAPKEGEVELFVSPVKRGQSYMEIEHQGKYESLAPGESLSWPMKWYLRILPRGIKVEVGNEVLVDYVRNLIK